MDIFLLPAIGLVVGLVGVGVIDEREKRIPNRVLLVLVMLFLAWTPVFFVVNKTGTFEVLGVRLFASGATMLGAGLLAALLPRSFGMGDAKLMAVVVLYLGPLTGGMALWGALVLTLFRGLFQRCRRRWDGSRSEGGLSLAFAPQVAAAVVLVLALILRWR